MVPRVLPLDRSRGGWPGEPQAGPATRVHILGKGGWCRMPDLNQRPHHWCSESEVYQYGLIFYDDTVATFDLDLSANRLSLTRGAG
jgi:hypothetical protein